MAVSEESAYTSDMSWKDHLNDAERKELEEAEAKKKAAAEDYNALWRKLKSRCDSRIRQAKKSNKLSTNSGSR